MTKTISILVVCALLTAACGERPAAKASATQVVAKVNDEEISIHQVNYLLQRSQAIPPEQLEATKRKVLQGLVDQQLLVQQALEAKLDRTPAMSIALEAARREVLARGYVEHVQAAVGKPSESDAKKFFDDNPDLFAKRKVYRLEEAFFEPSKQNIEIAKRMLAEGRPMADIAASLRGQGAAVAGGVSVKPAEKLMLYMLPQLAQAADGMPQLFVHENQASIVTVLESKPDPISESKARPLIEYFLLNRQKSEVLSAELKRLHEQARIAYVGEFADVKLAEPATPVVADEPATDASDATDATDAASIKQGIRGLN